MTSPMRDELRTRALIAMVVLGVCAAAAHSCTGWSSWTTAKRPAAGGARDASVDSRVFDASGGGRAADARDASPPCPTERISRPRLAGAGRVAIARLPGGGVSLTRDGDPYFIRGVGGQHRLDLASALGANSTRTWGSQGAQGKLDAAAAVSMTVTLGVWLEPTAARYGDEAYKNGIRQEVRSLLDSVSSHPALLMWALGNEINNGADTKEAWTFVGELAKTIRASDPLHPVATVIAGSSVATLNNVADFAPAIDVVGVNSYAAIGSADGSIRQSRFAGPYMITEWGPNGWWEEAATPWGRPFEPTSAQKTATYASRYDIVMAHPDRCIGSYVFLWGQKQERTPTWFGLFVEKNADLGLCAEACPTADAMAYAWSGKTAWPANRAPTVSSFTVAGKGAPSSIIIAPGATFAAVVGASDPDGDDLRFAWELLVEPRQLGTGGSYEGRPPRVGSPVFGRHPGASFAAPSTAGQYRLFVYVLDGHVHAGTANLPFLVQ
jgi:hypothetical protein